MSGHKSHLTYVCANRKRGMPLPSSLPPSLEMFLMKTPVNPLSGNSSNARVESTLPVDVIDPIISLQAGSDAVATVDTSSVDAFADTFVIAAVATDTTCVDVFASTDTTISNSKTHGTSSSSSSSSSSGGGGGGSSNSGGGVRSSDNTIFDTSDLLEMNMSHERPVVEASTLHDVDLNANNIYDDSVSSLSKV